MATNFTNIIRGRGFTLIEAIVYFAIFGITAVLGVTVLSFALESRNVVRESGEVQLQAQRAMEFMVEKVRTSVTVLTASTTASELWLKRSGAGEDPTVFRKSSGAVTMQEGTAAAENITPESVFVTQLVFTEIENPAPATTSVRIVLTMGFNKAGEAASGTPYTLQTSAMPLQ